MELKLFDHKGVPLERQRFTWRELVQKPISKLDDDAFTRARVILMNGIETDAIRFQHGCARRNLELRLPLAKIRRVEQHQATMVNWLIGADHSPLETTIAYEQVAVEVTASVAQNEPDPYMAQVYRFGLLEDFDHLYRYSALLDRLEGKDSNNILQGYTDVVPARPTELEHRAPEDDIRNPYSEDAAPPTKIHAMMITAAEYQTHDYYMNIGPLFADPVARLLYAEIASIEEQHVTQYGSLINPQESWLEHWLTHEAMEAYAYHCCLEQETNPRLRAIWERFLDYELGHFHAVAELMQIEGKRDPEELFGAALDRLVEFKPQREFYRAVLDAELGLSARGPEFIPMARESDATLDYRRYVNSGGSPSSVVSAGYWWSPGTELVRKVANY
jgi:hypothetical protein